MVAGIGRAVATANRDASGTAAAVIPATVLAIDWTQSLAIVNAGGGEIRASWSGTAPRVGISVSVLIYEGGAIVLGSPGGPALGTVIDGTIVPTADGDVVLVMGEDGAEHALFFGIGYTPAAGDLVLISWEARGHILLPISGRSGAPAEPVVPPSMTPTARDAIFRPQDSASWRGSAWATTDVVFGESYSFGGWFYGAQIRDTIGDAATITKVTIYVEVTQSYGAATAQLGLHTAATRPGGPIAVDNTLDVGAVPAGTATELLLPNAWGDLLKTGDRNGVGTAGTGFRVFRGVGGGTSQGALKIEWTE